MGIEEIRASGLLELYVMDQLSPAEKAEVEGYVSDYPELKQDLREIEISLEIFAMSAATPASAELKDKILNEIRQGETLDKAVPKSKDKGSFGLGSALVALLGLGMMVFGYLLWQKNIELEIGQRQLSALRDTCEQSTQRLNAQLEILKQLTFPDNSILPFKATPGFASTDLYLHYNTITKRSFIQVRNLPVLEANQSFQLWSLKPNQAPVPLTVFDLPANGLIEVQFEDGTDNYAITIEPKGGRETPTLEQLIGTVSVAGI